MSGGPITGKQTSMGWDQPIPLLVELCAGTAALSLRLSKVGARPPVSRMGSKAGYAHAILQVLGLRPGQGAERFLWCEPDPGCRLLLEVYRTPGMAQEVATILRKWDGEDPRGLWDRLRAEGPPRWSTPLDPREVARWVRIITANRLIPVRWDEDRQGWFNTGVGGTTHGGEEFATAIHSLVSKFLDLDVVLQADVERDSRTVDPSTIPEGTVAYFDPPYVGTTGYGADLSREEVVTIARRWSEAGAWVVISEAEPIPELVEDGWSKVEITWTRRGGSRTFSKQQREWLTLSRPPKAHPGRPTRPILSRRRGKVLR